MTLSRAVVLSLLVWLQGCASTSVFVPYPEQAQSWKAAINNGTAEKAVERLSRRARSTDRLLYLQERARLAQLAGQHGESRDYFDQVFSLYEERDAEARLRLSELGSGTASLMLNDNALPYTGYPYERTFAHAFQALNFMAMGNAEATDVELRRAALEQRVALNEHERDIARAERQAREEGIDLSHYEGYFQGLNTAASRVKSAIQNAWVFYLSAVFRESREDYNAALVDYKKALEIHPDSDMLKADVQRVSRRLDGSAAENPQQGLVVVLHEQGFVPPRREVSIPVPTIHGYFAVAFPTYHPAEFSPPRPLTLRIDGQPSRTEALTDVGGMAARALKERMPAIILRQTLRASAKYGLQKKANRDFGAFGAFATQIYNLVSERADLRTWLTLPAHGLATRLSVPAGTHRLQLSGHGGGANVDVPVTAGRVTLVRVIDTGTGGRLQATVLPVEGAIQEDTP